MLRFPPHIILTYRTLQSIWILENDVFSCHCQISKHASTVILLLYTTTTAAAAAAATTPCFINKKLSWWWQRARRV